MDNRENTSDTRIEVESKIAFIERAVDDLNDVILDQARSFEALEARLAKLEARLNEGDNSHGEGLDPLEERPPHY